MLDCKLDLVLKRVDGDRELLAQMAQIVLAQLDELVAAARAAIVQLDGPQLQLAAHRLKGTVGNFEVARLFDLAHQLERAGAANEFTGAATAMAEIDSSIDDFRALLEGFAHSISEPLRGTRGG